MARKDEILSSFLNHDLLRSKYGLKESDIPSTLRQALLSEVPIIRTIALIVDKLESSETTRDNDLRNVVTQYLSQSAI